MFDDTIEELTNAAILAQHHHEQWNVLLSRLQLFADADDDNMSSDSETGKYDVIVERNNCGELCSEFARNLTNIQHLLCTCKISRMSIMCMMQECILDCNWCILTHILIRGNFKALLQVCLYQINEHETIHELCKSHANPDRMQMGQVRALERGLLVGRSKHVAVQGTALHLAVIFSDHIAIQYLLDKCRLCDIDIDPMDSDAETPLFLAVKLGRLLVVTTLLTAGANIHDTSGYRYLSHRSVDSFLDTDNYNAITPLSLACSQLNADMIRMLLQARADPNAADALDLLPRRISPMLTYMEQGVSAMTHGSYVTQEEIVGVLELLLASRADVNGGSDAMQKPPRGSLYIAAQAGWTDAVKLLLTHCADPQISCVCHEMLLHLIKWRVPSERTSTIHRDLRPRVSTAILFTLKSTYDLNRSKNTTFAILISCLIGQQIMQDTFEATRRALSLQTRSYIAYIIWHVNQAATRNGWFTAPLLRRRKEKCECGDGVRSTRFARCIVTAFISRTCNGHFQL